MVTGIVSESDHLKAYMLHLNALRNRMIRVAIFATVSFATMLLLGMEAWTCAFITLLMAPLMELILTKISLPRKLKKIYRQQVGFTSPLTYTWDATSLQLAGRTGTGQRAWKEYIKYKEDEHSFLLYQTDILFQPVPKAWFRDAAQIDEFRKLAALAGQP